MDCKVVDRFKNDYPTSYLNWTGKVVVITENGQTFTPEINYIGDRMFKGKCR